MVRRRKILLGNHHKRSCYQEHLEQGFIKIKKQKNCN